MKRYAYRLLAVWLPAVSLAGCSSWWPWGGSSGEVPRVPPGATAYKCDENKELYVRYIDGGKSAMVIYPEREFRLDSAETGSGVRYTNGHTTLRTKGSEATLEEGNTVVYSNCKSSG
jgi:membrane-bound inhibitor of C-type lysozyme